MGLYILFVEQATIYLNCFCCCWTLFGHMTNEQKILACIIIHLIKRILSDVMRLCMDSMYTFKSSLYLYNVCNLYLSFVFLNVDVEHIRSEWYDTRTHTHEERKRKKTNRMLMLLFDHSFHFLSWICVSMRLCMCVLGRILTISFELSFCDDLQQKKATTTRCVGFILWAKRCFHMLLYILYVCECVYDAI